MMRQIRRFRQDERGRSGFKTMIALAILVAAIYSGFQLFMVYDENWTLEEHISSLVRFAFVNMSGDREQQITNQITDMLDEMHAQYEKKNINVLVDGVKKEITVDVQYAQTVPLPFFPNPKQFHLHLQSSEQVG